MKNVVPLSKSARVGYGLTPRETEVMALAVQGLNRPQIAERLGLRSLTVGTHLKKIYPKLGVHNRAAAVAVALRQGLVSLPTEAMGPGAMAGGKVGGSLTPPGLVSCPNCGCHFAGNVSQGSRLRG